MMHAYKRRIVRRCSCGKIAAYEVLNTHNASMGFYCSHCADRKVRELKALKEKE